MVVEGFVRDRLLLRAPALAYFTVLSVVPLLAVAVSIAGAVGIGTETFIDWVVQHLRGRQPERAGRRSWRWSSDANFAGLGTVGAAVLFLTTVLAIGNVESALQRHLGRRRVAQLEPALLRLPRRAGDRARCSAASRSRSAPRMYSHWLQERLLRLPVFARLYHLGLAQLPTLILCAGVRVPVRVPAEHARALELGGDRRSRRRAC